MARVRGPHQLIPPNLLLGINLPDQTEPPPLPPQLRPPDPPPPLPLPPLPPHLPPPFPPHFLRLALLLLLPNRPGSLARQMGPERCRCFGGFVCGDFWGACVYWGLVKRRRVDFGWWGFGLWAWDVEDAGGCG